MDLHLAGEGRHEELYAKLGAHVIEHQGVRGTAFAVWAPSARSVSVVGDFNSWDGRLHPMRSLGSSGIWELFLPGVEPGTRYKYEILTQAGEIRLKADPLAFATELPPQTASVVYESRARVGRRRVARAARARRRSSTQPISIYEVHLGSWRLNPLEGNRSLTYLELADELAAYAQGHGLHPHRAAAGDGAPVQRLVGLPGDGLLRADAALRHARTTSARSSTACTSTGSA